MLLKFKNFWMKLEALINQFMQKYYFHVDNYIMHYGI